MAHDVEFSIPPRSLGKADVEFIVKSDGVMLGTLTISRGTLVWFPTGTTNGYRMTWEQFDRLVKEHVVGEEKR